MNLLIADDDVTTVQVVTRLLSRNRDCNVLEAHNGLEALDILQRETVDVMLLDVRMPLMDGVETLRVLRESPRWADLPVVVLSGAHDEAVVRQLISLGVRDFIVKPLGERFVERLEALLKSIEATADSSSKSRPAAPENSSPSVLLVADGDAEYRRFFAKNVGAGLGTVEAESGVKALEMCLTSPPDAVFLGNDLGLMSGEQVARCLRASGRQGIQIFGVPLRSEASSARASGVYDDVFVRTYVPASFKKELTRLLRRASGLDGLCRFLPDIRTRLIRSVEQVFGSMFAADVESTDGPVPHEEPRVWASVVVTTSGYVVTLRIQFETRVARQAAAAFLQTDADGLGTDELTSVASEVVNALADRFQTGCQERGAEALLGPPSAGVEDATGGPGTALADLELELHFSAIDRTMSFQVGLGAELEEAGLGAEPEDGGLGTEREKIESKAQAGPPESGTEGEKVEAGTDPEQRESAEVEDSKKEEAVLSTAE